ncbi:MAG: response regulator [Atribacterota bacterium]
MNKNKKNILIVDDEETIRDTLSKILEEDGFDVESVDDAEKAIKKIKNEKYNLILLDLKLNGMSGFDVLKETREINKELPIILISGYLTMENIEKACGYGIFNYIRKPFELDDLRDKIKRALKK